MSDNDNDAPDNTNPTDEQPAAPARGATSPAGPADDGQQAPVNEPTDTPAAPEGSDAANPQ